MSDNTEVPYTVSPLQLSILLETARKHGGPTYLGWFVKRWVKHVQKKGPPPGDDHAWLMATEEDK